MNGMSWIIIGLLLVLLVGAIEKTDIGPSARIRDNRSYRGGRQRVIDLGGYLRGKPPVYVNGKRTRIEDLAGVMGLPKKPKAAPPRPPAAAKPAPRTAIAYTPPAAASAGPAAGLASEPGGVTVDFFEGVLRLVNAPYEGPKDALRQLRTLGEGGRQWNNGLVRLHQRMSDRGDMRIDPFVSEHVLRAASFGQAMVLELVESDAAMTALLNMSLAELTERGFWIPNTHV